MMTNIYLSVRHPLGTYSTYKQMGDLALEPALSPAFDLPVEHSACGNASEPGGEHSAQLDFRRVRRKAFKERIDQQADREVDEENRVRDPSEPADQTRSGPCFNEAGIPTKTEHNGNGERNDNTRAEVDDEGRDCQNPDDARPGRHGVALDCPIDQGAKPISAEEVNGPVVKVVVAVEPEK